MVDFRNAKSSPKIACSRCSRSTTLGTTISLRTSPLSFRNGLSLRASRDDAANSAQKVHVPGAAAQLAVRHALEAYLLLSLDHVADGVVLDAPQLVGRDAPALELLVAPRARPAAAEDCRRGRRERGVCCVESSKFTWNVGLLRKQCLSIRASRRADRICPSVVDSARDVHKHCATRLHAWLS